jgi:hypothetical protein
MRNTLSILSFVAACFTGCADPGGPSAPSSTAPDAHVATPDSATPPMGSGVTGRWKGTFMTDNALVSMGDFTFDLTEDTTSHAVTGPFTGAVTAGVAGTMFQGTFTSARSGAMLLNGSIAINQPAGVTGTFDLQPATITGTGASSGDTVKGMFKINVVYSGIPLMANGSYTITKQ